MQPERAPMSDGAKTALAVGGGCAGSAVIAVVVLVALAATSLHGCDVHLRKSPRTLALGMPPSGRRALLLVPLCQGEAIESASVTLVRPGHPTHRVTLDVHAVPTTVLPTNLLGAAAPDSVSGAVTTTLPSSAPTTPAASLRFDTADSPESMGQLALGALDAAVVRAAHSHPGVPGGLPVLVLTSPSEAGPTEPRPTFPADTTRLLAVVRTNGTTLRASFPVDVLGPNRVVGPNGEVDSWPAFAGPSADLTRVFSAC